MYITVAVSFVSLLSNIYKNKYLEKSGVRFATVINYIETIINKSFNSNK